MRALMLVSDFRDYYDHAFERRGPKFHRLSKGGMPRREMFSYLQATGWKTPRCGIVSQLIPALQSETGGQQPEFVVYTDELAHAGDGKVKIRANDALRLYPDRFCSEFLATCPSGAGTSIRYLQVGDRKWWLRYWSETDWRSNVGEGGIEVIEEQDRGYHPEIKIPMFAVDLVPVGSRLLAIDFNTAPGLGPLRDILAPSEVIALLGDAIESD